MTTVTRMWKGSASRWERRVPAVDRRPGARTRGCRAGPARRGRAGGDQPTTALHTSCPPRKCVRTRGGKRCGRRLRRHRRRRRDRGHGGGPVVQGGGHVRDALEPGSRLLLHGAEGHRLDRGRDGGLEGRRERRSLVHVFIGHRDRILRFERLAAREHLVEDASERVDVRTMIHRITSSLLGRKIARGSEDRRGVRDALPIEASSDPEVHQLRAAVGVSITLPGFTSRCTIPAACATPRASATLAAIVVALFV